MSEQVDDDLVLLAGVSDIVPVGTGDWRYDGPGGSDFEGWQTRTRRSLRELLSYQPDPSPLDPELVRAVDMGDYRLEYVTFATSPRTRIPAYVLIPKTATGPMPALIGLHDHGGFYAWGKEKLVELPHEHASLSEFKVRCYEGRSIATDLARQGYVVVVIDMWYWGERRLVANPLVNGQSLRDVSADEVADVNKRAFEHVELACRAVFSGGATWTGIMAWDDVKTVDYLISRPEVDPQRIGCVGMSVGGYRAFLLAALDTRVAAAIDAAWMSSIPPLISTRIRKTMDWSLQIPGLQRHLDFPELAALIAPRHLLLTNGMHDVLFTPDSVEAAKQMIQEAYRVAGAPDPPAWRSYDAPHEFNVQMQADAWEWLREVL
jgi:dienelactone hydrolase